MLEIKNLVKVYRTKGGAEVRAVDGISLSFADKGMVFLLGKSGSGKSTLLNLCGGLDAPDDGEIIIKGRSSLSFSAADFDSYRNTFVGFVFQEYNILDEFSVADNIALALELQGKNKDGKAVAEILEKVDLADFAKRKPNTLSGGQKQRVAIARALVKNPEIILADEPTGALDSNTGKQVLDTLKKLSEEKLVIVVSHDREFAEQYGDRVIELKDGKVISDVTKTKIAATEASENVSFIGDDTVSVKDGSSLTDEDMKKIKKFLSSKSGKVMIASGEKEVTAYKKAAKIDEDGAKESFRDTTKEDVEAKAYSTEDGKLIRSKLPAKHAFRIGASSLKVKPFRLFFTIFLSFIAFAMFGLFSTLTFYNKTNTAVETYKDSGYEYLYLGKNYLVTTVSASYGVESYRYETVRQTLFTKAETQELKKKYGAAYGAYNYSNADYSNNITISISNVRNLTSSYYSPSIRLFVEIDDSATAFEFLTDVNISALGAHDVVISSYLFDSIKQAGLYKNVGGTGEKITLSSYDDIVGQTLYLASPTNSSVLPITVRGVYKFDPPEKYANLKNGVQSSDDSLLSSFQQELTAGMYAMALVSPSFYDANTALINNYVYRYDYLSNGLNIAFYKGSDPTELTSGNAYYIAPLDNSFLRPGKIYFFGEEKETLAENEIVVSYRFLAQALQSKFPDIESQMYSELYEEEYEKLVAPYREAHKAELDEYYEQQYQTYIGYGYSQSLAESSAKEDVKYRLEEYVSADRPNFATEIYEKVNEQVRQFSQSYDRCLTILESGQYNKDDVWYSATSDDYDEALAFLEKTLDMNMLKSLTCRLFDREGTDAGKTRLSVVGIAYGDQMNSADTIWTGKELYSSLKLAYGSNGNPNGEFYTAEQSRFTPSADAIYNLVVIPFPEDKALTQIVSDENVFAADDTTVALKSPLSDKLAFVNQLVDSLEKVFLWVGVVMALFSMLLLFNFISVSIANKKKEIGILRAVGARSADVFKIFYAESSIITLICFALAMVACFVICPILNNQVAASLGASIFVFGPVSWLVMLGIAVLTSVVATFLPVYAIAKKRPVESIRAL